MARHEPPIGVVVNQIAEIALIQRQMDAPYEKPLP
jgi:hypothetical protein